MKTIEHSSGWQWLDHLVQDLRHAVRVLMRSPAFTDAAIAALALGIGANTAIFSVVYTVLFRPLPYPEAERLTMVWETRSDLDPSRFPDPKAVMRMFNSWLPDDRSLALWRERNRSFELLAGFNPWTATFTGAGEPERLDGAVVTPDFFTVLRAHPVLGRTFLPEENSEGRDDVVVLAYGLWQRRFGSDPGVLGRRVLIDGSPHTVVGVMPAGFETVLPHMTRRPDLYLPLWQRIGSTSCLIAAASLGHAPLRAIPPASDKGQYVECEACASTAAAFHTGTVSLDMLLGTPPPYCSLRSRSAGTGQIVACRS